jgi:two-component system alkaline phosphatase synthesis response regulator PhoP
MTDQAATILVVDDEVNLAKGIKENLEIEGHSVEAVFHGRTALEMVRAGTYDLVILDVMLPGVDGFTLCKTMRDEGQTTPVLFLTAKGEASDRIRGLEAGGDDYLPKPFHLRELLLRVHAILRRSRWYDAAIGRESEIRFEGNEFDFRSFKGRSWEGKEHAIPHKEAMIFKVLAERSGEVVSRDEILETVWGSEVFPSTRTIDNFIVRLRKRFEPDPESPRFFHTVRGVGYRFTPTPNKE